MTGDEFHLIRRRARISQTEVAIRARVSQKLVSQVENDLHIVRSETRQCVIDALLTLLAERRAQLAAPLSA